MFCSNFLNLNKLNGQCQADFSAPDTVCFKDTVFFTNNSTAAQPQYEWDFGDVLSGTNNTDTLPNPFHLFSELGKYKVRLILSDTGNCIDTFYKDIVVLSLPTTEFFIVNPCQNLNTLFEYRGTIDSLDAIHQISWNFGTGMDDTGAFISRLFNTTDSIKVMLKVETAYGCVSSKDSILRIFPEPIISKDKDSVCTGATIMFSVNTGGVTPNSYQWNLGDGNSTQGANPIHAYDSSGTYYPRVELIYSNGAKCLSNPDTVFIAGSPDIDFYIPDSVQCFKSNEICVHIRNQPDGILYRNIVFDDGHQDVKFSPTDSVICHQYKDTQGGIYSITVEIVDKFQCSNIKTINNSVVIHPILNADFDIEILNSCFKTDIRITNLSNQTPSKVTSYYWDLGDSTVLTNNWSGFNHSYTVNGSFDIKLWLENDLGCVDSLIKPSAVTNTIFIVDAKVDSMVGHCFNDNTVYMSQTPISGGTIFWNFGSAYDGIWNVSRPFSTPGIYYPSATVRYGDCDSTVFLDSIEIFGPQVIIGNVNNRYQCQIHKDVTIFNGTRFHGNDSRLYFWDFGDAFAPQCTTVTKENKNVNMNCNYSRDSVTSHNHSYKPGEEDCYRVRLTVSDTIVGCSSTNVIDLPLMPPNAKPAPPSRGLFQNRAPQCLGKETGEGKGIILDFSQTEPPCGRARHWVMWDSLCAAQSGNFDSFWRLNSTSNAYSYDDKPCDPNGWVTVGLIIENGNDSNGMVCRDTAWYHNFMRFSRLDPRFTIDVAQAQVCMGTTVGFSMIDSLQDSIVSMEWYFGNTLDTNNNNSTRYHTFNTRGEYNVRLTITNAAGCTGYHEIRIRVGAYPNMRIPKYNVCIDEEVQFYEEIRYFTGGGIGFWRNAARKAAGKETVLWDFGDGGGFVDVGPTPKHKYSNTGNYTIRIAYRDSLGCWDTLTHPTLVRVHGAFANFSTTKDTFFCAQTVAFTGQGTVIDPVNNYGQPGDQITNYLWQFASYLPTSSVQNPFRFLQPGDYQVKLTVTNTIGCKGDITKPVVIVGPRTKFSFAFDSSGCSPLEVIFKNESQDANLFIWQFKDLQNNTFTTQSDSQVRFTYADPGKFYPMLIARGQFNANGINVTCETIFPDTSINQRKEITVFPLPSVNFTHVTNCVTKNVTFTNTSSISSGSLQSYYWDFGDGNSSTIQHPSHSYADTGRFNVTLIVYSAMGCTDSILRTVVIAPSPIIMFRFESSCFGQNTMFFDSSVGFNDIILDWRWDFGDGTSSTLKNPSKLYSSVQTYQVTMSAMNSAGCRDSVTRNVRVHPLPTADFNISNSCNNTPLYLNSNSTSSDLPLTFLWNFGDGTTSTTNPVVKSYANPGNYNIRLRVETPYGCRDSITKANTIHPVVNTAFSINQRQQCVNENRFEFKDESTITSGTYNRLWRFGDGSSSSDSLPIKTYASSGTYIIYLITLTDQGCRDTLVDSVIVFSSPAVDFTINQAEQCRTGNRFTFTDQTNSFEAHTRTWSLGDGNGSTSGVVNHSYQDTGIFIVRLIATTISGCRDTTEKTIRVLPMPVTDFNFNNPQQCLTGNQFSFQNQTLISWGNLAYQWHFGDQTGNTQTSTSKSYNNFGTFQVKLIATSIYGCKDSITKQVVVHPMPDPDFIIADSAQCVNTNRYFFNNQSGIPSGNLTYFWKFGDGNTAMNANPNHRYAFHNTYKVWLIAQSGFGCTDSSFRDLVVYPKPQTNIIPNDTNQCLNINNYQFSTNRSIAYGSLVSYQWDLQNGFNYGTADTSAVFNTHGNKLIRFVAESNFGCYDTSQLQLIVHPQPNAMFNINDSAQCVNDNDFRFINTSNVSSGNLSYFWQFGDGSTDSSMNPSHTYSQHDTLTATLFAISNFNCTDTTERTVIVWPKPDAWFIYNDSGQCLSVNYFDFINQSTIDYGILSYDWDFGEGITSTATDTQIIYQTHSPKDVRLIAISDNGCRDTVNREIEVYPMPLPEFLINDTAQCLNFQSFEFSNQSVIDYGEVTYYWDFGDGQSSNNESPEHVYQQIGYYRVTLHVSSGLNCRDSISDTLRVLAIPEPKYLVNDSAQCVNVQDYIFTDNSTIKEGQNVDHYWTFGQEDKDTGLIVSHYFQTSGFFRIKLEVLSDRGCMDSMFGLVRVYPKPIAFFEVNDSAQCLYQNDYMFSNTSFDSLGIAFQYWNVNGQGSFSTPDAAFIFADSGYKQINLQVESIVGCRDTFERTIYVKPMPDPLFDSMNAYYCNNEEPWELKPNTPGGEFIGKNVQGTFFVPEILWRDTVFHRVTVNGCTDSSYQYTQVYPHPEVALVPDTQLCLRDYIEYDVSFWNSRYLWSTNHTDSRIIINTPGFYWVDVTNLCGTTRGETNIRYFDHNCRFFMPNAFSPNADDLNERFKPVVTDVREMFYEIYNRWGEVVYKGHLHDEGWDGTFMGKPAIQGVYVVVIRYVYDLKDGRQAIENEKGVLHLLR